MFLCIKTTEVAFQVTYAYQKFKGGRKGRALILRYVHDRTILEVKKRYIAHTGHDITFVHQCTYLVYIVLKTSRNSQMTLCNSHQVTRIWWWENDTDTHCAVHPKLCIPSAIKTQMHIVPICFGVDEAVSTVLKISVILLKYSSSFQIFVSKTNTKLNFLCNALKGSH